jgi:MraZ protein
VFRGGYEHAIDGKGRVSLPARFREALDGLKEEPPLVATTSNELCLRAYPLSVWREFEAKLGQQPQFNQSVRRLTRHFVGNAQDLPIDGMGRVLIPPPLREYAGIQKEVVFVGQVKFIEIWSKERWEKARTQVLDGLPTDLQALSDLGL